MNEREKKFVELVTRRQMALDAIKLIDTNNFNEAREKISELSEIIRKEFCETFSNEEAIKIGDKLGM